MTSTVCVSFSQQCGQARRCSGRVEEWVGEELSGSASASSPTPAYRINQYQYLYLVITFAVRNWHRTFFFSGGSTAVSLELRSPTPPACKRSTAVLGSCDDRNGQEGFFWNVQTKSLPRQKNLGCNGGRVLFSRSLHWYKFMAKAFPGATARGVILVSKNHERYHNRSSGLRQRTRTAARRRS